MAASIRGSQKIKMRRKRIKQKELLTKYYKGEKI